MATSGTVGQTVINVSTLIEHAFRRAGKTPSDITSDDIISAKENIYFFLCSLANAGDSLWAIDKEVVGLKPFQAVYDLEVGTQEIKKCLYRTVTLPSNGTAISSDGNPGVSSAFSYQDINLTFTQSSPNGYIAYNFGTQTLVSNAGFLPSGDQMLSLVFEASVDGVNWNTVYTAKQNVLYPNGIWAYFDFDYGLYKVPYFRMRETNGGTISVNSVVFSSNIQEIEIARMNIDQYTQQNQKTQPIRQPTQYWYDRRTPNPRVFLWQMPNYAFDQVVFWRTRQIQDVGDITNEIEVPARWYDALMTDLAWRQILEIPGGDIKRITMLEGQMNKARMFADMEERDKSPVMISMDNSAYTA